MLSARRSASMKRVLYSGVVLCLAAQVAGAAWIPFVITSTHVGQSAKGWEQIFRVSGTGQGGNGIPIGQFGFDYAFLVANTSAAVCAGGAGAGCIDGFFFSVGVANNAAAISAYANARFLAGTYGASGFGGADPGLFPAV